MRKYLSAACAVLLGLLSVSCNEKEEALVMEITPLELSIDPEGGNKTFTVKSNKDWTLVADKWITASTTGEKGSDVTVTVNPIAGKNSSTERDSDRDPGSFRGSCGNIQCLRYGGFRRGS